MSVGVPAVLSAELPPVGGNSFIECIEIPAQDWGLKGLAGRFIEISGGPATASLSVCARLVREAQQTGGIAVWVGDSKAGFFPPDLAANGVYLPSLAVVRVEGSRQVWGACDTLLRSGGFTLLVADIQGDIRLSLSEQTRLSALAQHHHAALVVLTKVARADYPRGSLVSLRAETEKRRTGHECFACEVRVTKDKRRVPGWAYKELFRGSDGLC